MSLWKRGRVYWTYVYVDGVRHSKSTGTAIRRQAEQIEQRFKEELNLRRQGIVQLCPDLIFGDLTARFLAEGISRPYHIDRLKVLLPYFAETPIGRINKTMAREYRRYRREQKAVTETTINRDMEVLRHLLYWAVDEGLLATNPLSRVPLAKERRKPRPVMTLEEEEQLLEAAAPHLRPIIIAALDTGMRRGEILNQRWEHVDLARELLSVTKSKTAGGEAREIPLTRRLFDHLNANCENSGLAFTFSGRPITRIKTAWKNAILRAKVRYCRFHDLRHTFNTRLMEAGVMQEIRKALMGHSSGRDVHSMYTHVEMPVKREAIRKLEVWVQHQKSQIQLKGDRNDSTESARLDSHETNHGTIGTETLEEKIAGRSRA